MKHKIEKKEPRAEVPSFYYKYSDNTFTTKVMITQILGKIKNKNFRSHIKEVAFCFVGDGSAVPNSLLELACVK